MVTLQRLMWCGVALAYATHALATYHYERQNNWTPLERRGARVVELGAHVGGDFSLPLGRLAAIGGLALVVAAIIGGRLARAKAPRWVNLVEGLLVAGGLVLLLVGPMALALPRYEAEREWSANSFAATMLLDIAMVSGAALILLVSLLERRTTRCP